ncbi:MAG: hypothetical protein VB912_15210 [Pirellulaceae bacterium]
MYTRRSSIRTVEDPGQDSFLDIVANLVGVLIILVMVVAVRAREAIVVNRTGGDQQQVEEIDTATPRVVVEAVTTDIHRIDRLMKRQDFEIAFRRKERDKVLALLTAVESDVESQRQQLSQQQQRDFDLRDQVNRALSELVDIENKRSALNSKSVPEKIIEHFPTPMAKTVFGWETHFQLKAGRLAYVPWNRFIKLLQKDAPRHVWKLKDAARTTEMLGPVEGFRMKYTMINKRNAIDTRQGSMVQRRVELEKFELTPISPSLGETVPAALKSGSNFLATIGQQDKDRGTITIWVYPDSFGQFREVRGYLHKRGYTCASRPLPSGHPIGGSPDGTRTVAQ